MIISLLHGSHILEEKRMKRIVVKSDGSKIEEKTKVIDIKDEFKN